MPARIFKTLPAVFTRTFKEQGTQYWQRHDADEPVVMPLIFQPLSMVVDAEGVEMTTGQPAAFVEVSKALLRAPERAGDLTLLFDNDDLLIINGVSYAVESCTPDGYGMCKVELIRKRT